ncbi:MAG: zinc carboxypeptidase [Pseudobdellovibrionaceae bacterium]|nr:MAG: zinc carboxypeptidase [Pseudobdellovibrionaceae bacterium]
MIRGICIVIAMTFFGQGQANGDPLPSLFWVKAKAANKYERTQLSNMGLSIEGVGDEAVTGFAIESEVEQIRKQGLLISVQPMDESFLDFPSDDEEFHNYSELVSEIKTLSDQNPSIFSMQSIGKSHEGRDIWVIRIGMDDSADKPAALFMGGHHAREHLSVETPLNLAKYLVSEYRNGNTKVASWVQNRIVYIIPLVNPDGAEYDIESCSRYCMWRKNRSRDKGGSYGVDLNRNYGYLWGTVGSSPNPRSDTYRGPSAFSEPETKAVRDFIDARPNITTLLTFHSFSELILYPWGHTYDDVANIKDRELFQTMAQTMAGWNNYTPQQSSDLYLTSGDTVDWAYGEHGIIGFTFELDPSSMWEGGFYPGQSYIDRVFQKNIKPLEYLIEYSDNPYRVLEPVHFAYGLSTPLID